MGRTKKVLSKGRNVGGIILIFVTVGTHEQGMERLLIEIDNLIEIGVIQEQVFAQIGYSKYTPKNYMYTNMIKYDEMDLYIKKARIVITHGGPGSIFHPLQYGKIPVVVPRDPKFNEHVDNHQILFAKRLESDNKIIGVYDIKELGEIIMNYEERKDKCIISNETNKEFIERFEKLINDLLGLS